MTTHGITKGTGRKMTHLRARRLPALTLTAGLVALCVAACGSSSSTSSTSSAGSGGSSGSAASAASSGSASGSGFNRSKLTACLKAHGVTLPARPGGAGKRPPGGAGGGPGFFGGGGGSGGRAGGRFTSNPKLRAAFQACGGGRGFSGRRRTLSHAAVTKFVACVKQHGYNLPSPNFSGKGPIFPVSIEKNTKFQAAAKSCQADLRPAGNGSPPAPGGSPGSATATTSGA
jgi:hypothetical protein